MIRKTLAVAAATATAAAALLVGAPAASAESDVTLQSGSASTLRVRMWEHSGFGGAAISYYGSGNCSASTSDTPDYRLSSMPGPFYNSWDDSVSSFKDFASCDLKLFGDENFGGGSTGWMDTGGAGRNLGSTWNDKASSFAVS